MTKLDILKKQLEEASKQYQDALKNQSTDYLLSLEWIKDCDALFKLETPLISAAGMPKFKIRLFGKLPEYEGTLTIVKNGEYYKDIVYSSNYCGGCLNNSGCCIFTYDTESFLNFLNSVRFKSFTFENKDLKLLNQLEEYKKTYEL